MAGVSRDDAEEFTAGLGHTAAGMWRLVAFGVKLGVPKALGLTPTEWVEDRLGGYVRLAVPERRAAAAELADDGLTQREIAEVLGVGKGTVDRDLHDRAPNGASGADDQDSSAADAPSGAIRESNEERAHRQQVERDAERLRKFISGWFTFSTLATNPARDDIFAVLVEPDRAQLDDITRRITWTT